jgi:hypothetical protein
MRHLVVVGAVWRGVTIYPSHQPCSVWVDGEICGGEGERPPRSSIVFPPFFFHSFLPRHTLSIPFSFLSVFSHARRKYTFSVAILVLAVRCSNHSARSHQISHLSSTVHHFFYTGLAVFAKRILFTK